MLGQVWLHKVHLPLVEKRNKRLYQSAVEIFHQHVTVQSHCNFKD